MAKEKTKACTNYQAEFVVEYLTNHKKDPAAAVMVINPGMTKEEAVKEAQLLMRIKAVQDAIAGTIAEALERAGVNADRLIEEIYDLISVDLVDIFEDDGSLKPLSEIPKSARKIITGINKTTRTTKNGSEVEYIGVKLLSKDKLYEMLCKSFKMFVQKTEKVQNINITQLVQQITKEEKKHGYVGGTTEGEVGRIPARPGEICPGGDRGGAN